MSQVSYSVKVNGEKQRIAVDTNTGDEHLHQTSPVPKTTLSNTQKEKLKAYGLNLAAIVILWYILWCAIIIFSETLLYLWLYHLFLLLLI